MIKRGCFLILIFVIQQPVSGQHVAYTPVVRQVPVLASRADSLRLQQLDSMIFTHSRNRNSSIKIDSILALRRHLMETRRIGFRNQYRPHPKAIPWPEIENYPPDSVKFISISGPRIHTLPDLRKYPRLEAIELIDTSLDRLPGSLRKLRELRFLYVLNNKPADALKLNRNRRIERLAIRTENPATLPRSYSPFRKLRVLDLGACSLTEFPHIRARHGKLRELLLAGNRIDLADASVRRCGRLEKLDLQNNGVTKVPNSIARLRNLRKLLFNNNQVAEVSEALGKLKRLEELSFYKNQLGSIPPAIYRLSHLRQVDLYYNKIERVDPAIGELHSLRILYLAHNRLVSIPPEVGRLPDLTELYLHNNRLSEIPESFCELRKLKTLRINNNNLAQLPGCFTQLSRLEYLDFSSNQFREMPIDFTQFGNLQILSMVNNPFGQPWLTRLQKQVEVLRNKGAAVNLESFLDN